jgi:DHA1 family tetracycline resistance protein-like MFS transporter
VLSFIRRQLGATAGMLRSIRGNAKAILVTEPFWGVPNSLYATYASVYMLALGCSATQVGLVSSVGLAVSVLFSLAGGPITDRLGRKRTTLIFDLLSWGGATLLWAFARGFPWFLVAVIANSLVRIVQTSWFCLSVEDTPVEQRVHLFSWLYVVGVVAGLIAPVAGLFVGLFGVVPAMRGLYLFAFVSMVGMFIVRNGMVRETRTGEAKMRESRGVGLRHAFQGYGRVISRLARTPLTLVAFSISTLLSIQVVLRTTFLAILLTRGLAFPEGTIAIFPAVGAVASLLVYLLVLPSLFRHGMAKPMLVGLALSAAGALALVISPPKSWVAVIASTLLTAAGSAIVLPFSDTLVANTVEEHDRATALSLFYVVVLGLSAPFGYVGGLLYAINDRLPFAAAALFLLAAAGLTLALPRLQSRATRQPRQPR